MELKFIVKKDSIIKDYLLENGVSRTLGRRIKLYGEIFINDVPAYNYSKLKENDVLKVVLKNEINPGIKLINKEINILYEDEWILIVNKENDLAIQPSNKHLDDNLVGRILNYFKLKNDTSNCHILTRLDYATSGIVIVAKNAYSHNLLANTSITKKYLAKTSDKLEDEVGTIHLPIGRDLSSIIKREVTDAGKDAITKYKLIKSVNDNYIYELNLITGRTHQIRVHLSHLNCPIIGDKLYKGLPANHLYLHCYMVKFIHPLKKEILEITVNPNWL